MSQYTITAEVLEILASRICHDLISPVSAVNNGVEFWEEMGSDAGDDAIELIAHSAKQASARLQLFRFAYAAGGSEQHVSLDDIKHAFEQFIDGSRTQLDWQIDNAQLDGMTPKGFCKIVLHLMMIGLDLMPKGGEITVTAEDTNSPTLTVQTRTESFSPSMEYIDVLEGRGNPQELNPKTVHPYLARAYSQHFNVSFQIIPQDDGVRFTIGGGWG